MSCTEFRARVISSVVSEWMGDRLADSMHAARTVFTPVPLAQCGIQYGLGVALCESSVVEL